MRLERRIGLFTGPAAAVFELATQAAKDSGHDRIEIGHLLLALVRAEHSISRDVLTGLGVNENRVEEFIKQTVQSETLSRAARPIPSLSVETVFNIAFQEARREVKQVKQAIDFVIDSTECNLSPDVKQALEIARARILDEFSAGTEHLLLGAVHRSEGTTGDVLKFLNVSLLGLRERIHQARLRTDKGTRFFSQ